MQPDDLHGEVRAPEIRAARRLLLAVPAPIRNGFRRDLRRNRTNRDPGNRDATRDDRRAGVREAIAVQPLRLLLRPANSNSPARPNTRPFPSARRMMRRPRSLPTLPIRARIPRSPHRNRRNPRPDFRDVEFPCGQTRPTMSGTDFPVPAPRIAAPRIAATCGLLPCSRELRRQTGSFLAERARKKSIAHRIRTIPQARASNFRTHPQAAWETRLGSLPCALCPVRCRRDLRPTAPRNRRRCRKNADFWGLSSWIQANAWRPVFQETPHALDPVAAAPFTNGPKSRTARNGQFLCDAVCPSRRFRTDIWRQSLTACESPGRIRARR